MKESEHKKNSMAKRMVGEEIHRKSFSERSKGVSNLESLRKRKTEEVLRK